MSLKIRVNNLNKRRRVCRFRAEQAARAVLGKYGKRDAVIDITFIGDRSVKRLNRKYMKRRRATDVLAFRLDDREASKPGGPIVGDVYISSDTAYRNAARFRTNFHKELILYVIHGVLHLLGFDDKSMREREKIRRLETRFLEKVWRDKVS